MFRETPPLPLPRGGDPLPNSDGAFARLMGGQIVEVDALDLKVHVNAIQNRA